MAETVGQPGMVNRQWIIERYPGGVITTDGSGRAGISSTLLGRVDEVDPRPTVVLGAGGTIFIIEPINWHNGGKSGGTVSGTVAATLNPQQFQALVWTVNAQQGAGGGTMVIGTLASGTIGDTTWFMERGL